MPYLSGPLFVVDLWLLSVTGLFLNHPKWRVNDYRANSQWIESTVSLRPATGEDPLEKADQYLRALGLEGELMGVRRNTHFANGPALIVQSETWSGIIEE